TSAIGDDIAESLNEDPPPHSQRVARPHLPQPLAAVEAESVETAEHDDEYERLGDQIVELLERVRLTEERAFYAEQELQSANAQLMAAATARPQLTEAVIEAPARSMLPWLAFALLGGLVAAAYFVAYAPLKVRYATELKQAEEQSQQHSQALASLRDGFAKERESLEAEIAAAKTTAAAPSAEATATPIPTATTHSGSGATMDAKAAAGGSHASSNAEARAARLEEKKAHHEEMLAKAAERHEAMAAKAAERHEAMAAKAAERREAMAAKQSEHKASGSKKSAAADDSNDSSNAKPAAAKAPSKPSTDELSGTSKSDDPLDGL
ncbi:MAG TPA: hypothetical protein VHZ95_15430, partial [Polyangiales bacterium]|nr:hypothetical protein [Polyangiales bacterium]